MRRFFSVVYFLFFGVVPAASQPHATVTMGVITLVSSAPAYIAAEKGYFLDAGLDVQIEPIESTGNAMPLLASNRMQILVGGVSAAYWNALTNNLPVILVFDSASSPVYTDILLRPDLVGKISSAADLRGRSIAVTAPGAIPVYQLAKLLQIARLSLGDVNLKYMAMPQMSVGLANSALDAALMAPPLNAMAVQQKTGVHWKDFDDVVRPQPMELAVYTANSDWMTQSRDEARKLFLALGRAARDYCQAYHGGPNRGEVEDIMVKYKVTRDRALLDEMPWQGRDPNGRVNRASIEDIQEFFFDTGMIKQKFASSRLVDSSLADYAADKLGPLSLLNRDSKKAGCR
jgi:NitT/TauT family transport system substrate-binding protein